MGYINSTLFPSRSSVISNELVAHVDHPVARALQRKARMKEACRTIGRETAKITRGNNEYPIIATVSEKFTSAPSDLARTKMRNWISILRIFYIKSDV